MAISSSSRPDILQWLSDLAAGISKANGEPEKTLALAGFTEAM